MPLFLLDRDGVVVFNRKDNIKTPAGLQPIAGAAARLNGAGFDVAICTNQSEVASGAMGHEQLDAVHDALDADARRKKPHASAGSSAGPANARPRG